MRILVTRPKYSGDRTAERLAEKGHEAVLFPLFKPQHDPSAALSALQKSNGAIAVTSAETIRVIAALWDPPIALFSRPLFVVGKTTAEQARQAGFTQISAVADTGTALAELVAAQKYMLGAEPLLYLAGMPRSPGFEMHLGELQIPVTTVTCYSMQPIAYDAAILRHIFTNTPLDAVLLYSKETAKRLFELAAQAGTMEALTQIRILCLSAAIADSVPDSLRAMVSSAATPDEDALLSLLNR